MESTFTYPAPGAKAITPSDTNDILGNVLSTASAPCRALYIGTSGDIVAVCAADNFKASPATVTFPSAPSGVLPIQVVQVLSTGTTATGLVALF